MGMKNTQKDIEYATFPQVCEPWNPFLQEPLAF